MDKYLPINLVMATLWGWIPFPAAAREAPGPTSRAATYPRMSTDDPSLERSHVGRPATVSALPWHRSL